MRWSRSVKERAMEFLQAGSISASEVKELRDVLDAAVEEIERLEWALEAAEDQVTTWQNRAEAAERY